MCYANSTWLLILNSCIILNCIYVIGKLFSIIQTGLYILDKFKKIFFYHIK